MKPSNPKLYTILFFMLTGYLSFAQPANDLICNAVTVTCGNTYSGTTIGATNSGAGESSFCVSWNQNTPGVWYKFIGNGNSVTFSLCGTAHDSELAIYTGTCTAPSCYAANDDNGPACGGLSSSIAITTVVGQTYWVKVFSWTTLTPQFAFNLAVSCTVPAAAPANDLICNATPVLCNSITAGTTINATNFGAGELGSCGAYTQNTPGVWYSIVGNGDIITASLCGTSHDSEIAVYTGTCTAPVCYGSNDDNGPSCTGLPSSYAWPSVSGVTYYIKVFSWSTWSPTFNFNLNVTCATAPVNDLCGNATPVTVPYNSGLQTNAGSSADNTIISGGSCGSSNMTVWFVVEGTGTTMTASTCNPQTNFDTEIHVLTGCSSGAEVACNDNSSSGSCSSVSWCSALGVDYYISVGSGGSGSAQGNFELTITASSIAGAFLDNSYVWRGQTNNWFTPSNWVVVDSVDLVTTIFSSATVPPTTNTNVYITPLGGCTNASPLINSTTDAFTKNLTILPNAKLTINGFQSELYISGDYWNDGWLEHLSGYVVFNGSVLQNAGGSGGNLGYNQVYNMRTEMTGPGIILSTPFSVQNQLDMISGNIQTFDANPLVLGEFWQPCYVNWVSGSVIGPIQRYFEYEMAANGYDDPGYTIFPLGSTAGTIINRNAWIRYSAGPDDGTGFGAGGFLRGEYKLIDPSLTSSGTNNLSNLTDPGNGLVYSELATEGYWEFSPNGYSYYYGDVAPVVGGIYDFDVRANEFFSVPDYLQARIVKSPDPHVQWEWDGSHAGIIGTDPDFTVSRTGLSDWSYFAIAYPQTPLNVSFGGANVKCENSRVKLDWHTMSETNSSHFLIETSLDGLNYVEAKIVQAAGNASIRNDYQLSFDEKDAFEYIRITEVDLDGQTYMLAVLPVNCSNDVNIYTAPNPSSNDFSLYISGNHLIGDLSVQISDAQGKIVHQRFISREKGTSVIEFKDIDLESGIYYVRVSDGTSSEIVKHSFR